MVLIAVAVAAIVAQANPTAASVAALGPAPQSAADEPCLYLPPDEVGAAFGAPYRVTNVLPYGPGENNHPGTTCIYSTDDQQFPSIFTLAVLRPGDAAGDAGRVRATFDAVKTDWTDSVPVADLGDDAFFNLLGLHVIRGDVYVNVGLTNTKPGSLDPSADQLRPLVVRVLDRVR